MLAQAIYQRARLTDAEDRSTIWPTAAILLLHPLTLTQQSWLLQQLASSWFQHGIRQATPLWTTQLEIAIKQRIHTAKCHSTLSIWFSFEFMNCYPGTPMVCIQVPQHRSTSPFDYRAIEQKKKIWESTSSTQSFSVVNVDVSTRLRRNNLPHWREHDSKKNVAHENIFMFY